MKNSKKFGTLPVFFTAIGTILGAVLFLRFGQAVGNIGFWGVILMIFLGHMVTIPTALALSEIATNKRVEGGGEYFVISRSFGLNIGSTIGVALFLSQAISIAFYVISFTEAFGFFFNFMQQHLGIDLPRQVIGIPTIRFISVLIIKKGANIGMKALYIILGLQFLVMLLFFFGNPIESTEEGITYVAGDSLALFRDGKFYIWFAICFPAFTGMTAGVGLSGDLKNPGRSIPIGTIAATFVGMIVYIFVAYKMAISASADDLAGDQLIMSRIAIGGAFMVPLGLATATLSSALGSLMVAPRTIQALAKDQLFPSQKLNKFLEQGRKKDGEPINASIFTCLLAFVFVCMGNMNAVAGIISMFFMLTYGSLCLISFLNHFGSSPSYRPEFKSKWWLSLIGFVISVWVMFKIDTTYAMVSFIVLALVYIYINSYHRDRGGISSIFINTLSQLIRNLQLFIQKRSGNKLFSDWRPSVVCLSKDSFERINTIRLLNWISYKYGFATYLHKIIGYYSKNTAEVAKTERERLIKNFKVKNSVFIDTIISPSYTEAISQAIQMPGVSGLENNIVLFEFEKHDTEELRQIIDNYNLVRAGDFDIMFLASSNKYIQFSGGIHIWLNAYDEENLNLMIMLSFIILNHPDWKGSNISVFVVTQKETHLEFVDKFKTLVNSGRIPIMMRNVEFIHQHEKSYKKIINEISIGAGLVIVGVRNEFIANDKIELFQGYDDLGDVLFVNSNSKIEIE